MSQQPGSSVFLTCCYALDLNPLPLWQKPTDNLHDLITTRPLRTLLLLKLKITDESIGKSFNLKQVRYLR